MKKMPCVFVRNFHGHDSFTITEQVTPGCEWVLAGEGVATRKWDGTACLFKDGKLWARYDAKRGKTPPPSWVACEPAADPITGHWPGWVPVEDQPQYKHHRLGLAKRLEEAGPLTEGATYELIGPGVQNNPENVSHLMLVPHGGRPAAVVLDLFPYPAAQPERTFAALREFLSKARIEGIVFHHPDGRMAKIRRADFGFEWGNKAKRRGAA
jgi:hypothetical protein